MKPAIVERPYMLLVGFSFFGDPFQAAAGWSEENEIGRTWQRFMTFMDKHGQAVQHVVANDVAYELHVYHEETPRTGEFEVFVGVEVAKLENVPLELTVKALPPATYAVFTLEGEQIVSDWYMQILAQWLPQAGYEGQQSHIIQRYDERFKGLDPIDNSVLEVYIPVKKRARGKT
jgi:predicted transcriptional regulator YdeE